MKRKIFFLIPLLVLLSAAVYAGTSAYLLGVSGVVVAEEPGGDCYNFDSDANGANLSTLTGWSGLSTDNLEVSNAQPNSGANSAVMTFTSGSTSGTVEYGFSAQTSTFQISFYIYFYNGTGGVECWPISFMSGETEVLWLYLTLDNGDFYVSDVDTGADTGVNFGAAYAFVEFELNLANDTYRVKVDGTERLTGTTLNFKNAVSSVDAIKLERYAPGTSSDKVYIDDICITAGAW